MKLNNRILSFDIETSSLDPKSGFIWSSGLATSTGGEERYFVPTDTSSPSEIEKRLTTTKFGQEQKASGGFSEYFKNIGQAKDQTSFTDYLAAELTNHRQQGRDILLVQNLNFERKWTEALSKTSKSGDINSIANLFMHSREIDGKTIPALFPSRRIMELRNEALGNYYEFLKTSNNDLFDNAAKAYDSIMQEYKSIFSDPSNTKIKPVDMMDFSRALLFKAAQEGMIDKNMALIGTSQNFLSEIFGYGKESHTALDDSGKALKIFADNLIPMIDELYSGNVSAQTRTTLEQISKAQPLEARKQFAKSLIRAIDEGSSQGQYRMLSSSITQDKSGIELFNNLTNQKEVVNQSYRQGFVSLTTQKDANLIMLDVASRYQGVNLGGQTAKDIISPILNEQSQPDKIDKLNKITEDIIAETEVPKAGASGQQSANIKSPSKKVGLVIGGLAVAGAASVLFSDSKQTNKKKQETDANLRMYSKSYPDMLDNYHGSGFADWNERTKHHYY